MKYLWLVVFLFLSLIFLSLMNYSSYCLFFDFMNLGSLNLFNYFFYFDLYAVLFLAVLFSIVFNVFSFISYYFVLEVKLSRFVYLLKLFIISMVLLMISPGLVSLFLGWDGLGFISFLLVCWFGSSKSFSASVKTFLVNRFGDSLLVCGLTLLFGFGGFNYYYSFALLFFLALMTKSALYPFSYWLPEAMAAPTPVSALVHSSTLVVAGLYILFRYYYLFDYFFLFILSCVGLFTLYYGSYQACITYDSKKLVAYSTLSQLGFLTFFLSFGLLDLFYYYLLVHAVFKASLFVSVGSYMVSGSHHQDMRYLSSLWFLNPLVSVILFFSVFSLSGFPFFSCFFIKELFLGSVVVINKGLFCLLLFFSSLLLTIFYSFRLLFIFIFNSFLYMNIYLNSKYSIISSVVFSFLMLFNGLYFSSGYSVWLNVGSSVLLFFMYGLVIIICYYFFLRMLNLKSILLNIFYSGVSYIYVNLFSISYVLDLNVFSFSFMNSLFKYIYPFYLYSRLNLSLFSLSYFLLFSFMMGLLVLIL